MVSSKSLFISLKNLLETLDDNWKAIKMSVVVSRSQIERENIMDDMTKENTVEQPSVDEDKLAKLKARLAEKEKSMTGKRDKALKLSCVSSGQAGNRLCAAMYKLGYDCVLLNTTNADLKFIDVPESNKLLISTSEIGGAARELSIGKLAAEQNRDKIKALINSQLADTEVFLFFFSLGGGTGAGSAEIVINILSETGKPIVCVCVLPMENEDVKAKSNALETLAGVAKFVQNKQIANLIVVDNSKLETIFHNVGQMDFYNIANKAIVDPIDVFNIFAAKPSPSKPLDQMEWTKLLLGEGLSVYGEITVNNYQDETAIAENILNNIDNNLLASEFDISHSKYVGYIVLANEKVWKEIPAVSINYANALLAEKCGSPEIYKGLYQVDMPDVVKVYTFFSGLSLPTKKIEHLRKQVGELSKVVKEKDAQRNVNLTVDTGKNETVSELQRIKDKIANKSSTFGKFTSGIIDRRK